MKLILITTIILFLFGGICQAQLQEYWVYLASATKYSGAIGSQAQKYDVVTILPVCPQFIPTNTEKSIFYILRMKNLDKTTISMLTSPLTEGEGDTEKTLAYRKYKLNLDSLNLKVGIHKDTLDYKTIVEAKVAEKVQKDLDDFEKAKATDDLDKNRITQEEYDDIMAKLSAEPIEK